MPENPQHTDPEAVDQPSREALLEQCRHLAEAPDVLAEVDCKLRECGFAGETQVPRLIFLALHTRFFERPVSVVIKGPSGSGKSYALRAALKFVPEGVYEAYSGLSDMAFVYSGLDMRHRYLVVYEAAGLRSGHGRTLLRQLLSDGQVIYRTVQSTSEGLEGHELPPIEGPTGLLMTTTATGLHEEDESRMLSVNMDESPERVRQTLAFQAAQEAGLDVLSEGDFGTWHVFHQWVSEGQTTVTVPFAPTVASLMQVSHHRVQRDFPQVLSLIKAHALLHQCARDRGQNESIVAQPEDYEAVYPLVAEVVSQGLEATVPDHIRETVEAVAAMTTTPDDWLERSPREDWPEGVSQWDIAQYLDRDPGVISRRVEAAIDSGYLLDDNPGQGRRSRIRLGERPLPDDTGVLPAPEQLRDALNELTPGEAA